MRGAQTDIDLLIDFVIWRCRSGNLPPDVRAAADRLAGLKGFAPPTGFPRHLSDGRYRLSVFDRLDGMEDSRPLAIGEAVEKALESEPLYLLICDVSEAISQGWEVPASGPTFSEPAEPPVRYTAWRELRSCGRKHTHWPHKWSAQYEEATEPKQFDCLGYQTCDDRGFHRAEDRNLFCGDCGVEFV